MSQAMKSTAKYYITALFLLCTFIFQGVGSLTPSLLNYLSSEEHSFEVPLKTGAENSQEKAAESAAETKEFTGNVYADLFSSLKYPVLLNSFPPRNASFTQSVFLPIVTPPPRFMA